MDISMLYIHHDRVANKPGKVIQQLAMAANGCAM